jgi:hypothetical protein
MAALSCRFDISTPKKFRSINNMPFPPSAYKVYGRLLRTTTRHEKEVAGLVSGVESDMSIERPTTNVLLRRQPVCASAHKGERIEENVTRLPNPTKAGAHLEFQRCVFYMCVTTQTNSFN